MVTRGFLRSLITNLRLESQNSKWRIQYGGQVHDFLVKLWQFCSNLLENGYLGVFEVSDYESEIRTSKFKMADPIWRSSIWFFCWNLDNFALIYLGTVTWGFLRSLITNLKLEPQNLKRRIQYGGRVYDFLVKLWQFCSNLLRNGYLGVFEVSDYESEIRTSNFKMAVKYMIFW